MVWLISAERWALQLAGRESAVRWFDLDALPDELIPYPATGIHAYRTGGSFSIDGWGTQAIPVGSPA